MFGFRKRRRERLLRTPLSDSEIAVLERNVAYYRSLSSSERAELHGLVQVFLAEKNFEGCGGLAIDEEIRVTIAAQACVLLLGRQSEVYPLLRSILVYPHAYIARAAAYRAGGVIDEHVQVRLGESTSRGLVVLSWDSVRRDAADYHDGHNVVFHEFAHQLDNESGATEGTPALPRRSMDIAWARVLGKEFEVLVDNVENHRKTVLDPYGATNPAEFFAVATECFFERPQALREHHEELYDLLAEFYRRDPASMGEESAAEGA